MLEILFIAYLCKKNAAKAKFRGKKPGGFIALTILLWFGMEFLGGLIGGAADMGIGAYVLALAMAGLGGFISHGIAANCKVGNASSDEPQKPEL